MGFNPPFDRDGKVICSQRYDFDILGVVEKCGISYSPKIIHTGTVNGQNDDEPEKHVGTPIVVQAHCLLGGVMKNRIIHHHFTHAKDTTPVLSLTSDETSRTENEEN